MKHRPLAVQISLVFGAITLLVAASLGWLYNYSLQTFFTDAVYENIESAQEFIAATAAEPDAIRFLELTEEFRTRERRLPSAEFGPGEHWAFYPERRLQPMVLSGTILFSNIRHLLFTQEIAAGTYQGVLSERLSLDEVAQLREEALQQTVEQKRYERVVGDRRLFYVVRRIQGDEGPYFLLSLVWEESKSVLEGLLLRQLLIGTALALAAAVGIAILIARYLTKPLVLLEKDVQRIASGDWRGSISPARRDEIGTLGTSIERMRQQLVSNDQSLQSSLQYISHELKTPVMVIRSYIQSIDDGIYPKGNLQNSLAVIDDEAKRLEGRIQDLLYFSKIDYLGKHQKVRETLDLRDIVEEVAASHKQHQNDLRWVLQLESAKIVGDPEQWRTVVHNLLDNQSRYAQSMITLRLHSDANGGPIRLEIQNDGPHIDPSLMRTMFDAYTKGPKGKTGLGLAIVKRIVELHGGKVQAHNKPDGVVFVITLSG